MRPSPASMSACASVVVVVCIRLSIAIPTMAAERRKVSRIAQKEFRKTRKGRAMVSADDVVDEMRSLLVQEMPDRSPGETITRCLETAAYRLGISFSRAQSYWWRKVRLVPAQEADRMRTRAREARQRKIEELEATLARLKAADDGHEAMEEGPRSLDQGAGGVGTRAAPRNQVGE